MTQTINERIHDPIHRVAYSFRREGGSLWVSTWLEDGGHLPEHFHPSLEEHWDVLEGTARVKLDGAWRDLVPEDGRVAVHANVRHELKNVSGRQAHLRAEVIPPGRLEEFRPRARGAHARASTTGAPCRRASAARSGSPVSPTASRTRPSCARHRLPFSASSFPWWRDLLAES